MTSLVLVLIIAGLFAALLTYESESDEFRLQLRPAGLLTWLASGNWPAKVGAGLMIIGVGALLRYAFANIDVPPEMKLGAGVVIAAALGFGSMFLKNQPKRRAVHLALAGAAFGVAYLTAYSAYGFFNYIPDVNALALLALVAVAAGVFAIQSNVMSVAILAMVGAYIAPKFALGTPSVLPVYGYYLAASVLSLVMVTFRGWRPLIHLSFLFTLAGGLFFGWSEKFYEPAHYGYMQPLLLALTAVHVAMPLLERKFIRSARFIQFDVAYFTMLPLVAAALTLKIAPDLHAEGAMGISALAMIWGIAAGVLHAGKHLETTRHALVAAMLATAATLFYFQDLPWLLVGLGLSVVTLVVASRQDSVSTIEKTACGAATAFGVLHIIQSITGSQPSTAFLSEVFAHRMFAGALMIIGAVTGLRREISFAKILGVIGFGWVTLAFISEVARLNIDYLPQLGYGVVLGAITLCACVGDRIPASTTIGGLLIFFLIGLGWWTAPDSSNSVALAYLLITPVLLLGVTWSGRSAAQSDSNDFATTSAAGLLPVALLPWAMATNDLVGAKTDFYDISIAMAAIVAAGLAGRYWLKLSARWNDRVQPLHVYLTASALLWVTLFHIERGLWPVMFEVLALGYLIAYVSRRTREQADLSLGIGAVTILSVALVLQAMLLRGFGPDDSVMMASDIKQMHLPAVASLMWVIFGSGLAWWGTNTKNRSLWSVGAGLLVVAAIKLVLFDFGALSQLGNIIAFIVAGMVFMGVAWFAPIPPKAEGASETAPIPQAIPLRSADGTQLSPKAEQQKSAQPLSPGAHPTDDPSTGGSQPTVGVYRTEKLPENINEWQRFLIWGLGIAIVLFLASQYRAQRIYKAQEHAREIAIMRNPTSPPPPKPKEAPTPAASVVMGLPVDQPAERFDVCLQFAGKLPSEFVVYAAGAYGGRNSSIQSIDQSGHSPTEINLEINQPKKPVVLMLGAYEPTIWKLNQSPETKVVAILLSGYHRQIMTGPGPGIPLDIPLLTSTYENNGPCGFFYITPDSLAGLSPLARRIFGRAVDMVFPATDGRVVINAANPTNMQSSGTFRPAIGAFPDKSTPRAGEASLEYAVLKGLLRRATDVDAEAWVDAIIQNTPQRDLPNVAGQDIPRPPRPSLHNAYVVLAPFTYPAGLFGGYAARFFIPKGVQRPQGNSGHSAIYDFNTLTCQGALCASQ